MHPSGLELISLQSEYGSLMPAQALNSIIEITDDNVVDVMITPERAQALAAILAQDPEAAFAAYLETNEDPNATEVVMRKLQEISLVRYAVEHVIGPIGVGNVTEDRSAVIGLLQEQLYGYYSPQLYAGVIRAKIQAIEAWEVPDSLMPAKAQLLDELEQQLEDDQTAVELAQPNAETLEAVHDWLNQQFGDIFDAIDEDVANGTKKYDAQGMARIFQLCIDSTPALKNTGWVVDIVESQKATMAVYAPQRRVVIPSQRSAVPTKMKELVVHEIFGHALRSAVAEVATDSIGQNGTASYARFEESFEIALEQCLNKKYDPSRGLNHYLAIGMAVSGGMSKDRIAHIFTTMHMLNRSRKGSLDETTADKARTDARVQIRRTFAGMTDVDDGIAHRKDIDYLHGLNQSWRLLNYMTANDCVDAGMRWLLSSKFNPYEPADRDLVAKYHPMPPQLQAFFDSAS